jgi:hypothetical protein
MLRNTTSLQREVQHPKKLHFLQNNAFLAIIKGITVIRRRSSKKLHPTAQQQSATSYCYYC